MRSLRLFPALLAFFVTTVLAAADSPPVFRGMLSDGNDRRFALASPDGKSAGWIAVGETFDGWTLTDYNTSDDSLVLKRENLQAVVRLSSSIITSSSPEVKDGAKASLADAEAVLNKMKFTQMMDKLLEQQKKSALGLVKQLADQTGASGVSPDELMAFQSKLMETMFAQLNADALRGDMAKIYSEVFTKQELQGLADFYSSPAGQAMTDKQPELAQKMNDLMVPRIMAAMPKVQQMAQDFAAQQAAKTKAAAPAAPAGK